MRLLLLALMIALLPLRSWVGDAMAMQMPAGHCLSVKNIAESSASMAAECCLPTISEETDTGCPKPVGAAEAVGAHGPASQAPASHGHCSNSSACLIYHVVGVVTALPLHASATPSHLVWPADGVPFASISLAPSLKPPIS